MGLEIATYISELVDTNPTGSDDYATADDHLRLIKSVLQAQFPNFTAAAMGATQAELELMDGATVTTAEINLLGGLTPSLSGLTATAAELNLTDGLLASTAELNTMQGITSTTAELNKLDTVTAVAADFNILAGASGAGLTAAELLHVNGVTSAIQTQIDAKVPTTRTVTAGTFLSGGGALSSNITLNFSTSGILDRDIDDTDNDDFALWEIDGTIRAMRYEDQGVRVVSQSGTQTFAKTDSNTMQVLTGATNRIWTINSSVTYHPGTFIMLHTQDTAELAISPSGSATLTSSIAIDSTADRTIVPGGSALMFHIGATEWAISGDIF